MFGLLRVAAAAGRLRAPASANKVASIGVNNIRATNIPLPYVPPDWIFRYLPGFCKDRVRFSYRFNQVSFLFGFGYLLFCHTPYMAADYDHVPHSWLYTSTIAKLEKSG